MCEDHDTLISDLYSNIVNAIVEAHGVTAIPQSCTEKVKQNDKYIRNIRLAESIAASKTKCF